MSFLIQNKKIDKNLILIYLATIILAFNSLIYELSFSALFSFLFGSTVEMYSLVIGFYLFSLGIGSFLFYKFTKKTKSLKKLIFLLAFIEISIIFSVIFGIGTLMITYSYNISLAKVVGFIFVSLIGVFSGVELPLLTKIAEHFEKNSVFAKILSLDYIGSLFAGVLFPLFFYNKLGIIGTLIFSILLNSIIVLLLLLSINLKKLKEKLLFLLFVIIAFFSLLSLFYLKTIQFFVIKSFIYTLIKEDVDYLAVKKLFGNVNIKIQNMTFSKYQIIYTYNESFKNYSFYCLGLNGVTQTCTHNYLAHHFAYILPFYIKNNLKKHYNVLILGGGDGILANTLLEFGKKNNITFNITQIELDKKVIDFCKNDPILRKLNNNSFSKIHLIIGDALVELVKMNKEKKKFDIVLDDLDISYWDNKIKFTSLEYFNLVKGVLNKEGYFITESLNVKKHFPLDKTTFTFLKTASKVFNYFLYYEVSYDTYKKNNIIITPYENAFLFTNKPFNFTTLDLINYKGKTIFVYYSDPHFVKLSNVVNFYSTIYNERINSIFWPNYNILKI
jgi:spermidine synthase